MPETRTPVDVRSATPTKQLVIERTLKASPERVFDAFTDPDQLKNWCYHLLVESSPRSVGAVDRPRRWKGCIV